MYKMYSVNLTNGKEVPLLAMNNREAMKLAGKLTKWYGPIRNLTDEKGEIIIENRN